MNILMVTGIEGAQNCAEAMGVQLGMKVEIAQGRRAALAALRKSEYCALVVDESIAECDPAAADAIWKNAGLAIPIQVNFAVSGTARLVREIRAALHRRTREQALAGEAAASAIEAELKATLAGLLLHSELALKDGGMPAPVAQKLRVVADLAGTLRERLSEPLSSPRASRPRDAGLPLGFTGLGLSGKPVGKPVADAQ